MRVEKRRRAFLRAVLVRREGVTVMRLAGKREWRWS
jgi:hypothetical protein